MGLTRTQRELLEGMGWYRLIETQTGRYTLRNHDLNEVGPVSARVVRNLLDKGLIQRGDTSVAGFTLMTLTPEGWTAVNPQEEVL